MPSRRFSISWSYECGDETIGFGLGHSARHVFKLFDCEIAADARADLAALEDGRAFGKRFVSAVEVDGQDAGARVESAR